MLVTDVNLSSHTSVGVVALDTEQTSQLRVRAYHYGTPSNTAHRTTGG
jgi:hypothetical protein